MMSFYKTINWETNGVKCDLTLQNRNAAKILATFLTEEKLTSWITDDFNLDGLRITYDEKDEPTVDGKNSHPIVSFDVLVERYTAMYNYLIEKGIILKTSIRELENINDLYAVKYDDMSFFKYDWDAHDLADTLIFIHTIIDVKTTNGTVTF